MKATHTPAPWKVAGLSLNDHEAFVIESDTQTICWTANGIENDEEFVSAEDQANALLIAAAPELLAALEHLLEDHKRMFPYWVYPNSKIKWEKCSEVRQAQTAITKANPAALRWCEARSK